MQLPNKSVIKECEMGDKYLTKAELDRMIEKWDKRHQEDIRAERRYREPKPTKQLTQEEYLALPPEEKAKVSDIEKAGLI